MTFQATVVQKKLEQAGFDARQALALASVPETDIVQHVDDVAVTREYLDARQTESQGKLDSRFSAIDSRFAAIESKMEARFAAIDSKMETQFAALDSRFSLVDAKLAELKAELLKWMIGLVGGSTLAVLLAILRLGR